MKHFNLKLAGVLTFFLLSISAFSQTNWQKGGNANTPPGSPPTLGTDNTWNSPLQFVTNGIQRMIINGVL